MSGTPRRDLLARLASAEGFVFDLDGSLVLGDKNNRGLRALPGAIETLTLLNERQIPFVVLTNGTVRTPVRIAAGLEDTGLPIGAARILTPATVAAEFFLRRGQQRILALGVEGVWQPLRDAGLDVFLPDDGESDVDAVFVGWYREFHMNQIELACEAVWGGAKLYGASMVPFFATHNGRALGSSRAICAMITSVTGKRAAALGKPSKAAIRSAIEHLDCDANKVVVVGDDPELEVAMARRAGAMAVAVHTGIAGAEEFASVPPELRPHLSLPDVGELHRLLNGKSC